MELNENNNLCLFAAKNGNDKLSFVCCKRKRKTEVCFPRSANNKRYLIDDYCFSKHAYLSS